MKFPIFSCIFLLICCCYYLDPSHPYSHFYIPHTINIQQNGFFEIDRNHRRRLVMPTNFLSFVSIVVKGSWAKVGIDISTGLEMTGLQSWIIDFFLFFCSEIKENFQLSIFKTCHSKASGDITTNFASGTLDINQSWWAWPTSFYDF